MFTKEYEAPLTISEKIINKYDMKRTAFFDIETTGFDKDKDKVILISLGTFTTDSNFKIKQYYAEQLEEEIEVLYAFGQDLARYDKWCSYNGIAFDEPFIIRRMEKNNVIFAPPKEHVDLYRLIRPYYKQLGMERCNLKSVEKHLGIQRLDKIDGAISVEMYFRYLETRAENLKSIIMLHNYEDVLNLPQIFKLIYEVEEKDLVREDMITEKQLKYLMFLLGKNNIKLNFEVNKISKKAASRVIDSILKGSYDVETLSDIVSNSY